MALLFFANAPQGWHMNAMFIADCGGTKAPPYGFVRTRRFYTIRPKKQAEQGATMKARRRRSAPTSSRFRGCNTAMRLQKPCFPIRPPKASRARRDDESKATA